MTTINKLQQALNSAKGLQTDLKTFSMDTEDQQAKQMFNQLSTNLDSTIQMLQGRVDFVNSEEPQYLQQSLGMQQQQKNQQQNQQLQNQQQTQQQNKNNQNKLR